MSYNGSGTFQINTSGQPVVTGTVISSSAFNALTADLATGLSTAITKDGQTTTTARIPFAQGINSSLATDTTSGSSGSIYTAGGVGITKGLFVGGTATFSATPVFSALTASSAVATDASKNLVSVTNTGTGNNVLATSPTLVTPALGTPSALVGTNITGTATSFNINGTVGATTPTTGAFTTLSATGVTTVQAGTAAAPAITTSGDTNTGIFFPAADTIAFAEGGSEVMRIDSSGVVRINNTSNATFSAQLNTQFTTAFQCGQYLKVTDTSSSQSMFIFGNSSSDAVGSIATSGSLTSYNISSDYRLKQDIAPMTGALAKVALLKPVTYKWKVDGSDGEGFIAHELAEVCPDAVTGEKDAVDANGKPIHQGIDVSFLVATLTAAIQELTARIAALEAK